MVLPNSGCQVLFSTKQACELTTSTLLLHVHPDVEIKQIDETSLELRFTCKSKVLVVSSQACFVENSTWHPEFGKTISNKKIVIPFSNGKLITEIKIQKE
jgi:uncharacterized heparinase superfamily protein